MITDITKLALTATQALLDAGRINKYQASRLRSIITPHEPPKYQCVPLWYGGRWQVLFPETQAEQCYARYFETGSRDKKKWGDAWAKMIHDIEDLAEAKILLSGTQLAQLLCARSRAADGIEEAKAHLSNVEAQIRAQVKKLTPLNCGWTKREEDMLQSITKYEVSPTMLAIVIAWLEGDVNTFWQRAVAAEARLLS